MDRNKPIFTVSDLETMKPSDLLEKAVEVYDLKFCWAAGGFDRFKEGVCCPAAAVCGAAGYSYCADEVAPPEPLTAALRKMSFSQYPTLGRALSRFSIQYGSFEEVIEALREIGC